MTEKQFWMKLDQLSMSKDKATASMKAGAIIRQAYDEDHGIIIGCIRDSDDPSAVRQLFASSPDVNVDDEGVRRMLCYTSKKMADSDRSLPEPWANARLRDIVDNVLNKPSIGGLLFNHHVKDRILFVPKLFLAQSQEMLVHEIARIASEIVDRLPDDEKKRLAEILEDEDDDE